MMPVTRSASAAIILAVAILAGCETRSRTRIYILNRNVKAGEVFDQTVVDEIGFSDDTGHFDVRKDFDFVTSSTLGQYEGQYFNKDLPKYTAVTTDVLAPSPP